MGSPCSQFYKLKTWTPHPLLASLFLSQLIFYIPSKNKSRIQSLFIIFILHYHSNWSPDPTFPFSLLGIRPPQWVFWSIVKTSLLLKCLQWLPMSHRVKAKVLEVTFRFLGKLSAITTVRWSLASHPSTFSWGHLGFFAHVERAGHSPASGCFWLYCSLPGSPCSLMFDLLRHFFESLLSVFPSLLSVSPHLLSLLLFLCYYLCSLFIYV